MNPHSLRSPLRCWQVLRTMQSYLDGVADDVAAHRAAEHLEECRRCGLEAATYEAIKESLARHECPTDDAVGRLRMFGESLLGA